jgi:predicted small metal-binding protein
MKKCGTHTAYLFALATKFPPDFLPRLSLFMEVSIMTRKYIDCREFPSDMNCSVAISADNDQELMEAAVQHAVAVHKHDDTPELRQQIKQLFKEGTPPIEGPLSHAT